MRAAGAAVGVALIALAPALHAGEAADKAAAQKLLKEGNQLLGNGDYLAALEKFRAAHARYPSAKILLNIGTTLRQLGRNIEAAEAYEGYLADPKAEPGRVEDLRRILSEIDALVARVRVEVSEPAAKVSLDGKPIKDFKPGMEIRLEAGDHTIVAEHDKYPPAVQTVKLAKHEKRTITLRLAPPEKVVVTNAGPQRTISYVFGGVGAAALLAGGISGIVAVARNQAAKGHCLTETVCDPEGVSLGTSAKTSALVSTITLAAGAGALATSVILYLTAPKATSSDSPPSSPSVGVSALAGGPFFTVEGRW